MSFSMSQEQFWQAVQIEEATDQEVGAGYTGVHLDQLLSNLEYFQQMKGLQSMVLEEFQTLLCEWNLGVGTEAAIACGCALLLQRFQTLSPEMQQQLWHCFEKSQSASESQVVTSSALVIREILQVTLLENDWKAIAQAAATAVQHQVLAHLVKQSA